VNERRALCPGTILGKLLKKHHRQVVLTPWWILRHFGLGYDV